MKQYEHTVNTENTKHKTYQIIQTMSYININIEF